MHPPVMQGLTTAQMKTAASFAPWSFVGTPGNQVWRMCADGLDTPRLSWAFARGGDFACPDGVGFEDLVALADHWLTIEAVNPASFNTAADADTNGKIDLADFRKLAENWPAF